MWANKWRVISPVVDARWRQKNWAQKRDVPPRSGPIAPVHPVNTACKIQNLESIWTVRNTSPAVGHSGTGSDSVNQPQPPRFHLFSMPQSGVAHADHIGFEFAETRPLQQGVDALIINGMDHRLIERLHLRKGRRSVRWNYASFITKVLTWVKTNKVRTFLFLSQATTDSLAFWNLA